MKKKIDLSISKLTFPVLLVTLGIYLSTTVYAIFDTNFNAADLGTFLGGFIGAGLSIITVLLIYQTYKLQEKELKEQREAFELTRVYDLIYREADYLVSEVNKFETRFGRLMELSGSILKLEKRFEYYEQQDTIQAISIVNQFNSIMYNEMKIFKQIKNTFDVLDLILFANKNKNDLIKTVILKLPEDTLFFCFCSSKLLARCLLVKKEIDYSVEINQDSLENTYDICDYIANYIESLGVRTEKSTSI